MDELNLLKREIIRDPADDTVRLAYADKLDELAEGAERIECPKCRFERVKDGHDTVTAVINWGRARRKCKTCEGVGTVLDTTLKDRAELIRTQVELARDHIAYLIDGSRYYHVWPASDRVKHLEKRERELLDADETTWFRGITSLKGLLLHGRQYPISLEQDHIAYHLNRGFVSDIACTSETFLKNCDSLIWNEKQKVRCPGCDKCKNGLIYTGKDGMKWIECRVPRPFPSTAQPIRKLTLTTAMDCRVDARSRVQLFAPGVSGRSPSGAAQRACVIATENSWHGTGTPALFHILEDEFPGVEITFDPAMDHDITWLTNNPD